MDIALEKFKDHPNVKIIKENVCTESLFHFPKISVSEMTKELSSLNSKKAGTFGNIPAKVLTTSSDISNKVLQKIWNFEILGKQYFPQNLKLTYISPVSKKKDPTLAENYRPVSVLPTVSKVFQRILKNNYQLILNVSFHLICVDIEKGLVRNLLSFLSLKSGKSILIIRDILGQF